MRGMAPPFKKAALPGSATASSAPPCGRDEPALSHAHLPPFKTPGATSGLHFRVLPSSSSSFAAGNGSGPAPPCCSSSSSRRRRPHEPQEERLRHHQRPRRRRRRGRGCPGSGGRRSLPVLGRLPVPPGPVPVSRGGFAQGPLALSRFLRAGRVAEGRREGPGVVGRAPGRPRPPPAPVSRCLRGAGAAGEGGGAWGGWGSAGHAHKSPHPN